MTAPSITDALQQFEAAEANLGKLERLWAEIYAEIPTGISFGANPNYEDLCRNATEVLKHLPKIDGWKPTLAFDDLDTIAQNRFDLAELDEPMATVSMERALEEPGRELREYRFHFNQKRRALINDALDSLIDAVDADIRAIHPHVESLEPHESVSGEAWDLLRSHVKQIDTLLGSSVPRPGRWSDLRRHLGFAMVGDFRDIVRLDWPDVKAGLRKGLFGKNDPIPVAVADLSELVSAKPAGPIPTKLNWAKLNDEDFERLIFALISTVQGYENPEWLMQTRAPDRGRDLSVTRITKDELAGSLRARVIIQCKHWQAKSISVAEVATLKEQMKLQGEPRVDVLVIATSGRFSTDAVHAIEQHNRADNALRIEMWPESHLEMLLAARPALIAEFGLR
jgi:restriction endonuclease